MIKVFMRKFTIETANYNDYPADADSLKVIADKNKTTQKENRIALYGAIKKDRFTPENDNIKIGKLYCTPNSTYTLIPLDIEANKLITNYCIEDEIKILNKYKMCENVAYVMKTNSGGIVPIFLCETEHILKLNEPIKTDEYFNIPIEFACLMEPKKRDKITHRFQNSEDIIKERYATDKPAFVANNICQTRIIDEIVYQNPNAKPLTKRTKQSLKSYQTYLKKFWEKQYLDENNNGILLGIRTKFNNVKTDYKKWNDIPKELFNNSIPCKDINDFKGNQLFTQEFIAFIKDEYINFPDYYYNEKSDFKKFLPTFNNTIFLINSLNIKFQQSSFDFNDIYISFNEKIIINATINSVKRIINDIFIYKNILISDNILNDAIALNIKSNEHFNVFEYRIKQITLDNNINYFDEVCNAFELADNMDYNFFKTLLYKWALQTIAGWTADKKNINDIVFRLNLLLSGPQFNGKSEFAAWLTTGLEYATQSYSILPVENNHDIAAFFQSPIAELAEETMFKRDLMSEFKSLTTRKQFKYKPKYSNEQVDIIRRVAIVMTVNDHHKFQNVGDNFTRFATIFVNSIKAKSNGKFKGLDKKFEAIYFWKFMKNIFDNLYEKHNDYSFYCLTDNEIMQLNRLNTGIVQDNEFTDKIADIFDFNANIDKWVEYDNFGDFAEKKLGLANANDTDWKTRMTKSAIKNAIIQEFYANNRELKRIPGKQSILLPPTIKYQQFKGGF